MEKRITYVGLDVHRATIAVALAEGGIRREVREHGPIANTPTAVKAVANDARRTAPRAGQRRGSQSLMNSLTAGSTIAWKNHRARSSGAVSDIGIIRSAVANIASHRAAGCAGASAPWLDMGPRSDLRRGCFAAIALASMADHYFHAHRECQESFKNADAFWGDLAACDEDYRLTLEVANGTKHAVRRNPDSIGIHTQLQHRPLKS